MHTENPHLRLVSSDDAAPPGELTLPPGARALLLMVFATAADRERSGYRFLADVLQANRIATLAFDLPLRRRRRGAQPAGLANPVAAGLRDTLQFIAGRSDTAPLPIGLLAVDRVVPACLAATRLREMAAIRTLVLIDGQPDLRPRAVSIWHRPVLCLAGRSAPAHADEPAPRTRQLPSPHRAFSLPGQTHPNADAGAFEAMACETVAWLNRALPMREVGPPGPAPKRLASPRRRSIVSPTPPDAGEPPWPTLTTTRWG